MGLGGLIDAVKMAAACGRSGISRLITEGGDHLPERGGGGNKESAKKKKKRVNFVKILSFGERRYQTSTKVSMHIIKCWRRMAAANVCNLFSVAQM